MVASRGGKRRQAGLGKSASNCRQHIRVAFTCLNVGNIVGKSDAKQRGEMVESRGGKRRQAEGFPSAGKQTKLAETVYTVEGSVFAAMAVRGFAFNPSTHTILSVVGQLDHLGRGLELEQRHNGPKGFL
jgi:hypothetical protein